MCLNWAEIEVLVAGKSTRRSEASTQEKVKLGIEIEE